MHEIEFITALFVYIVVLVVPGPNMVIIYNYSIQKNYNASILSGVGYGVAATVLATLSYFGVSTLKDRFIYFEEIMFLISGALLIWFGCKVKILNNLNSKYRMEETTSNFSYIFSAFMLNISNPKAIALLSSIYGSLLSNIDSFEAALFICFCLFFEIFWYYMLYNVFSSRIAIELSSKFILKITHLSRALLIAMGGYFLIRSVFAILARWENVH